MTIGPILPNELYGLVGYSTLYYIMSGRIPIQAVDRVFDLLEIIAEEDGVTAKKLRAELGHPKSTVHDYLQSLNALGIVTHNDSEYHVSTRFLEWGARRRKDMELFQVAQPELDDLAEETGEHASLMIEENGLGVLLYTARGETTVQVNTYDGARSKLHTTAPGKAILAHFDERRRRAITERYGLTARTENTITDTEELRAACASVRENGYAVDRQELFDGMRAVGVPILNQENSLLGAISVYGPVSRLNGERFKTELPNRVREAVNVVELNIKYA